jgi:hypothetical protein
MELFRDAKTKLVFPVKMGPWVRKNITTYPSATAGYSVIYQLRGWLLECKVQLAVDVYDKGIIGIPSGPHSPFVAIELQNCLRVFFPDVPAVDISRIDAYLAGTESAADSLVGQVDSTGCFRFASGELTMHGKTCHYSVYVLGHRGHFVKVQALDFTKGASSPQISLFLAGLLTQIRAGDDD